jgi:hydroxybutyrate-dimer hydrolase
MNRSLRRRARFAAVCLAGPLLLLACGGGDDDDDPPVNQQPGFVAGSVSETRHDGTSDDLLTAGLGTSGIGGAAPTYADPANPTPAELRRNAIHTNYRALIDPSAAGGYGTFFGPNVDNAGNATLGEGKIAGTEHIAYADDGSGRRNVTLMVQVPDSFDADNACIVTATSSGSRGIYGAIGTAGDWGLKQGCAVAYTDKGTGNGFHDLQPDRVTLRDGRVVTADAAGDEALFAAELNDGERAAFNAASPERVAYKHAHSQQNPEKDWGLHTLQAIELAFYVLNQKFGEPVDEDDEDDERRRVRLDADNTLVIASSVSNGGGAALAAAEQDDGGLIDGVAVSEPNAQPRSTSGLTIEQGATEVATIGRPLIDYFTHANLYQPCAALSSEAGLSLDPLFWPPAFTASAENRCTSLREKGLLSGATLAEQADEALQKLLDHGWQAESNFLQQSHYRFATNSIVVTYINAYGRFSVADNVCGFSFANTDASGNVIAQVPATQAGLFASGNGIPPTSGVNVVYNGSAGGAKLDFLATSPSTGRADFALDGALCMRSLVTGEDAVTGMPLDGARKAQSDRVLEGVDEVLLSADLRGVPTVIVAGRNDTLLPVNHAARAYVGSNRLEEGADSRVRYYEVTNAQHFDTFIGFGALLGYDTRFVPLHGYFVQAMNLMYAHLRDGAALPASQVVRTTPRASGQPLAAANVPPISATPDDEDEIEFDNGTLTVPD